MVNCLLAILIPALGMCWSISRQNIFWLNKNISLYVQEICISQWTWYSIFSAWSTNIRDSRESVLIIILQKMSCVSYSKKIMCGNWCVAKKIKSQSLSPNVRWYKRLLFYHCVYRERKSLFVAVSERSVIQKLKDGVFEILKWHDEFFLVVNKCHWLSYIWREPIKNGLVTAIETI